MENRTDHTYDLAIGKVTLVCSQSFITHLSIIVVAYAYKIHKYKIRNEIL